MKATLRRDHEASERTLLPMPAILCSDFGVPLGDAKKVLHAFGGTRSAHPSIVDRGD